MWILANMKSTSNNPHSQNLIKIIGVEVMLFLTNFDVNLGKILNGFGLCFL